MHATLQLLPVIKRHEGHEKPNPALIQYIYHMLAQSKINSSLLALILHTKKHINFIQKLIQQFGEEEERKKTTQTVTYSIRFPNEMNCFLSIYYINISYHLCIIIIIYIFFITSIVGVACCLQLYSPLQSANPCILPKK